MSTRTILASLLAATAVLTASCSAKTQMVTTWSAPGASKDTVKKVLVLGIAKDASIRRTYEDSFAEKLKGLGYDAIPGYTWEPDASKLDRDAIAARIKSENVSHVLVTRLVGTKKVETVTPATVTTVGYAPYGPGYYGGWGSYWSVGYSTVVSPGYTTINDVVTLETNFYDTSKDKDALVYSGQSETWLDQSGASSIIKDVIGKVVYSMRSKQVI